MPEVMTFDAAIADSERYTKRHLLLGNGFSIGCRAEIFHYASLFAEADFSDVPEVQSVFEALQTEDFEIAIRALESASRLLPIYASDSAEGVAKMLEHAAALKEILVTTIASRHPANPNAIRDEEFWSCRRFLKHFLSDQKGQHVFTLNYDLLLYWTLMHEPNPDDAEQFELRKNDSFGNVEDDPGTDDPAP